jgi:hypothetical protein
MPAWKEPDVAPWIAEQGLPDQTRGAGRNALDAAAADTDAVDRVHVAAPATNVPVVAIMEMDDDEPTQGTDGTTKLPLTAPAARLEIAPDQTTEPRANDLVAATTDTVAAERVHDAAPGTNVPLGAATTTDDVERVQLAPAGANDLDAPVAASVAAEPVQVAEPVMNVPLVAIALTAPTPPRQSPEMFWTAPEEVAFPSVFAPVTPIRFWTAPEEVAFPSVFAPVTPIRFWTAPVEVAFPSVFAPVTPIRFWTAPVEVAFPRVFDPDAVTGPPPPPPPPVVALDRNAFQPVMPPLVPFAIRPGRKLLGSTVVVAVPNLTVPVPLPANKPESFDTHTPSANPYCSLSPIVMLSPATGVGEPPPEDQVTV